MCFCVKAYVKNTNLFAFKNYTDDITDYLICQIKKARQMDVGHVFEI